MNYLILLNYTSGQVVKVRLTDEEKELSKQYEDFEEFMQCELEKKYSFRTRDVSWMTCDVLDTISYNF